MNWKEYIQNIDSSVDGSTEFFFNAPATENLFSELKGRLHLHELPGELEELYQQTNGVDESMKGNNIGTLIWNINRVISANIEYRSYPAFKELYMSFDELLFFSEASNGDLFGFITLNGLFSRWDIFVWNHEDDSRSWVAPNLQTFIKWWTSRAITR